MRQAFSLPLVLNITLFLCCLNGRLGRQVKDVQTHGHVKLVERLTDALGFLQEAGRCARGGSSTMALCRNGHDLRHLLTSDISLPRR